MVLRIPEPNTCIRGCCTSNSTPLHLPPSAYTLLSPIAKGAESVVYEGILDGVKVAVKKPILSTSDHLDKFHKELQMLCKMDHPGIVTLIAANAKPPNYLFFFRLYESNSLAYKLHVEEWSPNIDQIANITANKLTYEVLKGTFNSLFCFPQIVHSLDRNLHAYLSDFGLAEYKEDLKGMFIQNWKPSGKPTGGFHKKNVVGTLIYMAPEVLRKEVHSEKSDVYGFAVSMNELLTGVVPYTDVRAEAQAHTVLEMNYTENQLTASVVSDGLRPVLADHGSGVPVNLLSLIERCWDPDLNNRPLFRDIAFELEGMLRERQLREKEDSSPVLLEGDLDMNSENNGPIYKETLNWGTMGERLSKTSSSAAAAGGYGFKKWLQSLKDTSIYNPVFSWGSFATCGRRETMEDAHFLMPYICGSKDVHAFGVFDGHRGAAAAEFSAQALPAFLKNLSLTTSPADALVEAFIQTDAAFRTELDRHRIFKKTHQKNLHPGCTAAVVLIVGDKLFVANAGDCRTVLCQAGYAISLSKDHTASCPEERERVITAGGEVKWLVDTWRVGAAGLQVTRSIGDDDLKSIVIAEPEISETLLSQKDEYVVMASDGLWDVLSNEEVINIIRDTVKEPSMCSKRLATEAMERGSKDNITVVVIFLRPVSTSERVY